MPWGPVTSPVVKRQGEGMKKLETEQAGPRGRLTIGSAFC